MDVIDVDSSDSSDDCAINGFSRKRPSTSRLKQQKQQQSVPKPILTPRPRQQQRQQPQQQPPPRQHQQQRLQNHEYPVVAEVDLTAISDEEDGEIVENNRQSANNGNDASPAANGNLNLLINLNGNGIELDGLPMETLQIKREAIEFELKKEEQEPQNDLEPVSDDDGDDIVASNLAPVSFSTSLDEVSDDDVEMSFAARKHSNEAPMQSNTEIRASISIALPVGMNLNQIPRPSASNLSMQSPNKRSKWVQSSPNQTVQSLSESLENVSDDELLPPPSSKKSAMDLNGKRVVFSTRRPVFAKNKTESKSPGPNSTGLSTVANGIQQVLPSRSVASNTSMPPQNSLPNRSQIPDRSPNYTMQAQTLNASSSRSQISRNETPQSVNSNRAKKSPIHSQQPQPSNQYDAPNSSSPFWKKIKELNHRDSNGLNFSENHADELRKYGIYVSSDADAHEASHSVIPNQAPSSFMPDGAVTHGTSHRMHSNRTDPLPIANQRSPIYVPLDNVSNDMLSQNVDNFVRQKTPVRERAPQTPESGIAASEGSSDFDLDLYPSNAQSNPEPQKNHKTASNEAHALSNDSNQGNHVGNSNNSSRSSSDLQTNLGSFIQSSVKSIFFNSISEIMAKKRKTPSPSDSSSDTDEELMRPSKKQPPNSPNASHGGSCSKWQRNDSETDIASDTTNEEEDSNDGVDTQNEDPTYEPDTRDMDVDNREDENDAYDSDCSEYSNETVLFEEPPRKLLKSGSEEGSRDSDETIINFGQYYQSSESE